MPTYSCKILSPSVKNGGKSLTILHLVIYVPLSSYNICLVLYNRSRPRTRHISKCEAIFSYCLILGPLFGNCLHPRNYAILIVYTCLHSAPTHFADETSGNDSYKLGQARLGYQMLILKQSKNMLLIIVRPKVSLKHFVMQPKWQSFTKQFNQIWLPT